MTSPPRARRTAYEARSTELLGLRTRFIDVQPSKSEVDAPPLLLLHGHASRIEEYDALVPHFHGRRVIVLDLPGCGLADKPADTEYTLELYQDTALALLDQLGIERADVAGGSLGGNLTLRLGAREPDRFRRLAAWAPAGAWQPMKRWQLVSKIMRTVPALFWPAIWIQSRFWYSREWGGRDEALADAFRYYREVWSPGFFRMYWDVGHDQARTSLFDVVHAIQQPVFLGWGDRDHALGMGDGVKKLHQTLANARLHVFAKASHSLANERTEELGRAVTSFLEEAPAPKK
ncbi:MAG: alpha/beta fold hydrolase [Deltaproteobacteria bacterium]|jgi:pimeloyl-ACP methyl ester carboxylesterase